MRNQPEEAAGQVPEDLPEKKKCGCGTGYRSSTLRTSTN